MEGKWLLADTKSYTDLYIAGFAVLARQLCKTTQVTSLKMKGLGVAEMMTYVCLKRWI